MFLLKYTVAELAKQVGLKPSTIRFYIKEGLIKPIAKTESNYQIFNEATIAKINLIQSMKKERLTLKEIKSELEVK